MQRTLWAFIFSVSALIFSLMMVAFTKPTVNGQNLHAQESSDQSESELKNVGNVMNCIKEK